MYGNVKVPWPWEPDDDDVEPPDPMAGSFYPNASSIMAGEP